MFVQTPDGAFFKKKIMAVTFNTPVYQQNNYIALEKLKYFTFSARDLIKIHYLN